MKGRQGWSSCTKGDGTTLVGIEIPRAKERGERDKRERHTLGRRETEKKKERKRNRFEAREKRYRRERGK